jgi:hypothetical protein
MVCCEHGNELLLAMKGGKFLDQLNDYQLLKKDCTMKFVIVHPTQKIQDFFQNSHMWWITFET